MTCREIYITPDNFSDIELFSDGEFLTGLNFLESGKESYYCEKKTEVFSETRKWLNLYFDGKNPDTLSRTAMEQIAIYCKTTHWKKYGVTLPSRMDAGIEYALKYGYKKSKVINENGTYYPKFADIEGSLRGDRPVIMGVNGDGIGAIDHYVVVVGARKQQEKVLGKWKDRGWITYRCNWGWGWGSTRWIYAKDNEGDGEYPRHSTYQIWKINLAE